MANTLAGMDIERAWVVHGAAGWDEATPIGPFVAFDVAAGRFARRHIDPRDLGVPRCTIGGPQGRRRGGQRRGADCGVRRARPRPAPRRAGPAVRPRAVHRRPRRFDRIGHRDRRRGDRQRPGAAMARAFSARRRGIRGGRGRALMSGFLDEMARRARSASPRLRGANRRARSSAGRGWPRRRRRCACRRRASTSSPNSSCGRPPRACLAARATIGWARIAAYARGGAAAVSVLTEPSRFDGSLEHLERAAAALRPRRARHAQGLHRGSLPGARGARRGRGGRAGHIADAAARAASPNCSRWRRGTACSCCWRPSMPRTSSWPADARGATRRRRHVLLIGVNCRDLQTLEVVPERFAELAPRLPPGWPAVAESGVASRRGARRCAAGLPRWR